MARKLKIITKSNVQFYSLHIYCIWLDLYEVKVLRTAIEACDSLTEKCMQVNGAKNKITFCEH